jgi:hypothetical protein
MTVRVSKKSPGSRLLKLCYWMTPFILYSADAKAWGLLTHLYFAQSLLWAMPLLDPRLQRAIKQFPELVMAGACLPDLAIVSATFRHTHLWENAHQLLTSARSDEETAIAIGYASHLYVDVIAHNHFVPAYETMWIERSLVTHIAAEWAMDAHLSPLMEHTPGQLLNAHHVLLTDFVALHFHCSTARTGKALKKLAFWDNLLRSVRIPDFIYRGGRFVDRHMGRHFIYYIAKTQSAMANIGSVLEGERPSWEAELKHLSEQELAVWRRQCRRHLDLLYPAPIDYFNKEVQTSRS